MSEEQVEGKAPPEALTDPLDLRIREGGDQGAPVEPKAPSNEPPADDPELLAKKAKEAAEAAEAEADATEGTEDKAEEADKDAEASEEADKAEDKDEDKPDMEAEEAAVAELWEDTGSETGNAVLDMLKSSGVAQDEAKAMMYDAIVEGDLSKLDTAALKEKLGDSQAFLAEQGIKSYLAERKADVAAATAEVHDLVGGEDAWVKVRDWVNDPSNMKAETLTDYAEMIDKGGAQRRFAIQEMKAAFEGAPDNSDLAPSREEGQSSAPPAVEALSKVDYADQYGKVYNDRTLSPKQRDRKLNQINTARAAGRKAGI